MILAAGHYKQTQNNYIVAAALNIVISTVLVSRFGLIWVAIGILIAMLYQPVWMALYDSKNLIKWLFKNFLKQVATDIITALVMVVATIKIKMLAINYGALAMYTEIVSFISIAAIISVNLIST